MGIEPEELNQLLKDNPELSVDEKLSEYKLKGNPLPVLAPLLEKMTEELFLDWIIEEAHRTGWLVAHFRPAKTKKGWRTAVSADGAGFPDLIMVRRKRLIVAEVKSALGKVSKEQYDWLEAFGKTKAEVFCWTPRGKETILEILE